MKYNIAAVPGDGIGPEIVASAIEVLKKVGEKFGHEFNIKEYDAGGCAIDKYGIPLPKETTEGCLASDSVLLGVLPIWLFSRSVKSSGSIPISDLRRYSRLLLTPAS